MHSSSQSSRLPSRLLLALILAVVLAAVALSTASALAGSTPTTQAHKEGDNWSTPRGQECTKYHGKTYCGEPG